MGMAPNFPTIPDCISKQQVEPFFFPFIYNTLPEDNRTTAFFWDAYNQQNAYWIYMVAVMYKMMFSK